MCGWAGRRTGLREGSEADTANKQEVDQDTPGLISPDDYRQFWADAANGLLRLGYGNIVGFHTLMTMQDSTDIQDIQYAGVSTGWGSDGDWVVCIPERCTGVHDAVTASLVGMEVCDGCGNGCGGMCNPRDCVGGATTVRARPGRLSALAAFSYENPFCMGLLYGRAGRLTAKNGGFRRGQCPNPTGDADAKYGFTGGGRVNPLNAEGDTMLFHLAACRRRQAQPGVRVPARARYERWDDEPA